MMNCSYIITKGSLLAAFLLVWENEMHVNVIWWMIFCMLPSFIFAIIVIFGSTCYKTKLRACGTESIYSNYSLSLVLEEPPIAIVPVVTPFVFRTKMIRQIIWHENESSKMKRNLHGKVVFGDVSAWFEFNGTCTCINHCIMTICSAVGLILKAQMKIEVIIPISLLFLVITFPVLRRVAKDGSIASRRLNLRRRKKEFEAFYPNQTKDFDNPFENRLKEYEYMKQVEKMLGKARNDYQNDEFGFRNDYLIWLQTQTEN